MISDISKTDKGLDLAYAIDRGGQAFDLVMSLVKDGEEFSGTLGDTGGMFSADLTLEKSAGGGDAAAGPASNLDVAEVADAIGTWDISMDFQGNPVGITLTLKDIGGKVGGTLISPTSPDPVEITDIAKTDDGLELKYGIEFGGNPVDLIMALKLDGDALTGNLSDTNGMFSADLEGSKAAGGEAAAAEPFQVPAEDASNLDVAAAKDYIGGWKLAMELRGNPFNLNLVMQDVEGKVGAYITSMFAPEPSVIEEMEMTDDGLKMLYEAQFGPQRLDINIIAKLDGRHIVRLIRGCRRLDIGRLHGRTAHRRSDRGGIASSEPPWAPPRPRRHRQRPHQGRWKRNHDRIRDLKDRRRRLQSA